MTVERYLAEIADGSRPLAVSKLADLSAPTADELQQFLTAWARMDVDRQREILGHLAELAEQNPLLDFNDIFSACLNDPDETVRLRCIDGLWECENRSLIHRFIDLLRSDEKDSVRAAAATALGRYTLLAELGKLRPHDVAQVETTLLDTISDSTEEVEVVRRAVEAIAPRTLPQVREIIEHAYNSEDAKMRVSAVYAMGMNSDLSWLPTLLTELGSSDAEMRYEAARACGELGDEEAVPYLATLVHDLDTQVCLSTITALGKIGGNEAEQLLRECLSHSDEHVRDAAEEALDELSFARDPLSFEITEPEA